MSLQDLFSEIESERFTTFLGVVSTPRAFDEAVISQAAVKQLMHLVRAEGRERNVVQRVDQLLREPTNSRYCHDKDLPLGVYLRVLDICSPITAFFLAQRALELPNLWWGRAIAMRIAAQANRSVQSSNDFIRGMPTIVLAINEASIIEAPIEVNVKPSAGLRIRQKHISSSFSLLHELGKAAFRVRSQSAGAAA